MCVLFKFWLLFLTQLLTLCYFSRRSCMHRRSYKFFSKAVPQFMFKKSLVYAGEPETIQMARSFAWQWTCVSEFCIIKSCKQWNEERNICEAQLWGNFKWFSSLSSITLEAPPLNKEKSKSLYTLIERTRHERKNWAHTLPNAQQLIYCIWQ